MASFCRQLPDAGSITLSGGVRFRRTEVIAGNFDVRYGYSLRHTRMLRMKLTVVGAAGYGGVRRRKEKVRPCNYAVEDESVGNDDVVGRSGNRVAEVAVATAATVVYVIVYFGIMYIRHRAGIVTDEMLSLPKTPFVVIGLLEALAAATGMAAGGANLFGCKQKIEVFMSESVLQSLIGNILISIIRNREALWICLLSTHMDQHSNQLPNYLKDGAACFLNVGTLSSGCDGAPLLPILFIVVNIGFNIALLHLLQISSAVVSCLASTFSVPISIYVFTLPLPYLGIASSLPKGFVAGAIILLIGLLFYAWTPSNGSSDASFSEAST
ncbi:hypothetical protein TSUD_251750 [Trifolium subterraneum]|uniref:Uncharacterized protein n=1 Tax=Trifolium subterraneum TaxID=3900 RepID=A0A2Z6MZ87_TRISU|nr:hypothetical protein TSUD_251750 [Trifolium subterraneum]